MAIESFAFYDDSKKAPEIQKIHAAFDIPYKTKYKGSESLIVEEVPVKHLASLLSDLKSSGEKPDLVLPVAGAGDDKIKDLAFSILKNNKGSGYAANVVEYCSFSEIPASARDFLSKIYARFKKPAVLPPIEAQNDGTAGETSSKLVNQAVGAAAAAPAAPSEAAESAGKG